MCLVVWVLGGWWWVLLLCARLTGFLLWCCRLAWGGVFWCFRVVSGFSCRWFYVLGVLFWMFLFPVIAWAILVLGVFSCLTLWFCDFAVWFVYSGFLGISVSGGFGIM